jgi:7-cyano-7-deazaguanine synthase
MLDTKSVVLLSGGLDSSTLLFLEKSRRTQVIALSVHYGQRHAVELVSARRIANAADVELVEVALAAALVPVFDGAASSQVGAKMAVPEGHYSAENMAVTVVPGRNLLLLATAAALAVSRGAAIVAYAAHAGDHAQYPDCRLPFINATADALREGYDVILSAPFAAVDKTEIVSTGARLGVPFALTRSCYQEDDEQCGKCGTCVERREAFFLARVPDPTFYTDKSEYWRTVTGH